MSNPERLSGYASRGVRALVLMHEDAMREFLPLWRRARASGVMLPDSNAEAYRSLDHLLVHVFRSSGRYLTTICGHLGLPDPGMPPPPAPADVADRADVHLERLLAAWRTPLAGVTDDQMEPEVYVPGMHYWVDAMLEHAAFHPMRHGFQLRELMARSGSVDNKEQQ